MYASCGMCRDIMLFCTRCYDVCAMRFRRFDTYVCVRRAKKQNTRGDDGQRFSKKPHYNNIIGARDVFLGTWQNVRMIHVLVVYVGGAESSRCFDVRT